MISAAGLGLNPFQQARLLAMRRRTGPPAKVGFWRPRLAPPPPPPPPPAPPPAWARRWAAFRQQADAARMAPPPPPPPPPTRRTGAALFGYVDDFGRHARRPMPRPRRPIVRGGGGYVRSYYPEMVTLPVETIYLQPLPGCTVSPNPIPPCSGTLTWVDSRTVCCR